MTNLEKWRYYNKDCTSPESFIDFSFYAMIASSLQRKVWLGNIDEKPLFANMYVIFVGDPGVGKGLVVGPVERSLRHWKKNPKDKELFGEDKEERKAYQDEAKISKGEVPLLIQVGASATTYEKLVQVLSKSCRAAYFDQDDKTKRLYFHSSLTLCLSEISSLFRKHTEDVVNFLLCAYDCEDYRNDTISRGTDIIKNCCLNIIGGTTPQFLKEVFKDELLTTGFASRALFICEDHPRSYRAKPPEFNKEQLQCRDDVRNHMKKLTELYGEVKMNNETSEWLELWWKSCQTKKVNQSASLKAYYARKNITIQKLAMAFHFSDSLILELNMPALQAAELLLGKVELNMHKAVNPNVTKNPLIGVTNNLCDYLLREGKKSKIELLIEFFGELENQEKSLDIIISYLLKSGKIGVTNDSKFEIKNLI